MKKTEVESTDAHFSQAPYPVYPYTAEDEISLVDLAKVLIKQRWWLLGVAVVCFLAAVVYAMTLKPAYRYVSVYKVAEQEPNKPLTSMSGALEMVNNLYWPSNSREYKQTNKVLNIPFTFDISNPEDTTLVIFSSEGSEANVVDIQDLHQRVVNDLDAYQQALVDQRRSQLETQQADIKRSLNTMSENTATTQAEITVSLYDRLASVERQLTALEDASLIELAEQADHASRVGKSLILALGLVLGGMLGLMAAFIAEFVYRVKASLDEDNL